MTKRTTLWTVTDPRGLSVSLAADVWAHIVQQHGDMTPYFDAVRITITDPDEIYFDERSAKTKSPGVYVEAYYRRRVLTGRLETNVVFVSVKFVPTTEGVQGFVQTALPPNYPQRRMALVWKRTA